jgi:hypothetical protein
MNNSESSVSEALELAQPLIEKTTSQKLSWTARFDAPDAFEAAVQGEFRFIISKARDGYEFRMLDKENNDLLDVEIEADPKYGYQSLEDRRLRDVLSELYEKSRRSAYKIDLKVQHARSLLKAL